MYLLSLSHTHSFYLAGSNVKEGEKRKITFPLYLFLSYIILSKLKTRVLFLMREREENIRVRERERYIIESANLLKFNAARL